MVLPWYDGRAFIIQPRNIGLGIAVRQPSESHISCARYKVGTQVKHSASASTIMTALSFMNREAMD